jgi:hypothetical protein
MNNKEIFVEKLKESGEVKYEITEVHSRIIGKIKQVYALVFGREKRDFLSLKNMMFYKDGVPEPDSRSRLHDFLNTFVCLVHHYEFLGEDEISEYLKQAGIQITLSSNSLEDGDVKVAEDKEKLLKQSWDFAMVPDKMPEKKKEVLNIILDRALAVQKVILEKNSEIDEDASDVEADCQVKKPLYMKAIQIKVKELQKRSVDNELVKVEEDVGAALDMVSVFKEEQEATVEKDKEEEAKV